MVEKNNRIGCCQQACRFLRMASRLVLLESQITPVYSIVEDEPVMKNCQDSLRNSLGASLGSHFPALGD